MENSSGMAARRRRSHRTGIWGAGESIITDCGQTVFEVEPKYIPIKAHSYWRVKHPPTEALPKDNDLGEYGDAQATGDKFEHIRAGNLLVSSSPQSVVVSSRQSATSFVHGGNPIFQGRSCLTTSLKLIINVLGLPNPKLDLTGLYRQLADPLALRLVASRCLLFDPFETNHAAACLLSSKLDIDESIGETSD
nr:hypothetical protein Iba_chr02cCG5980 [Ipomoea batatas]